MFSKVVLGMELIKLYEGMENKGDLLNFLSCLSKDAKENTAEWENTTVEEFIEAIAGFIEDNNELSFEPIKWNKEKLQLVARLFYMGKIYE